MMTLQLIRMAIKGQRIQNLGPGATQPEHEKCPWCGSDVQHLHVVGRVVGGALTSGKAVHCQGCDAYGPSADTPDHAWAYWDGEVVPCA